MLLKAKLLFTIASLLFLFLPATIYSQKNVDLQKGLIGYYSFSDNNAADESGNGNDGETHGVNREKDVSGEKNGSYRWNDDDDHIKLPIDVGATALPRVTLCAWVYPMSYRPEIIVISNDDRGGDRKIYTSKKNKKRVWAISNGKNGFIGKIPVKTRQWVLLVATYDEKSKRASIYVDGVQTSGRTQMDMAADFTLIGANPYGNDDFETLIDEVRIYNRILSKSEINALRKLKPKIDNFKKKEENSFYLPKQNNLIVRSQPSAQSGAIGKLSKPDTLRSKIQVPSKGGKWNEWLKIVHKGKVGYVQLKYLHKTTLKKENISSFEKITGKYMNWGNWQFWAIMVLLLLIGIGGSLKFESIDNLLNSITGNDYEGNIAFFPILTGFTGFVFALLMLIWQDGVQYYLFENFSIWPGGYGFAAWVVWITLIINLIVFIILFIESVACGNIIHGLLRLVIQFVLSVFTFFSTFVITIAVIIIAIIVIIALIFLGSMFRRVVVVRE